MTGVVFEWDPAKAVANLTKHGVTFEEALTVFMDPVARIHGDPDHSETERREIIVGHSIHRGSSLSASLSKARRRGSLAPGFLRSESDEIMKKKTRSSSNPSNDDLRREYRFDYLRAKPNRFAQQFAAGSVAVVLDPDVASVFRTSESVNALLRSVFAAMPRTAQSSATRARGRPNSASQRMGADGKRGARR